jgi:hypothetical protein
VLLVVELVVELVALFVAVLLVVLLEDLVVLREDLVVLREDPVVRFRTEEEREDGVDGGRTKRYRPLPLWMPRWINTTIKLRKLI